MGSRPEVGEQPPAPAAFPFALQLPLVRRCHAGGWRRCRLPLPTLTLSTALVRTMPLLRVMGCWLCSRWSMSSGMVGKPSPSSLYRFCREGRLRGHLCVPMWWNTRVEDCTHVVCHRVGCMHEVADFHMAQAHVHMHDAGSHSMLQVWSIKDTHRVKPHTHIPCTDTRATPCGCTSRAQLQHLPLPGLPRCHGHSHQQPG